jgi:8-oxo-dGTP diphosphatase
VTTQVAAGIIRSAEGKILIAERFKACPHGGRWEFPGGTREDGETLEECLHRELAEELGIKIRIDEPLVVIEQPYADLDLDLHAFLCTHVGGDPKTIEVKDWRWVTPEELRDVNLTGADRKILAALEERWGRSE